MKRKTKFMTAILSQDEWKIIKYAMEQYEMSLEIDYLIHSKVKSLAFAQIKRFYNITHHFNSISVPNIESMADKIEKQRRKEKKSGKKNS